MEVFWRANIRNMEEATFSKSLGYTKDPLKKNDREHLLTDLIEKHGGETGTEHITSGERNWRESQGETTTRRRR